jgi:hypothetical protein
LAASLWLDTIPRQSEKEQINALEPIVEKGVFDLVRIFIERVSSWPVVLLIFLVVFRNRIEAACEGLGEIANTLPNRAFKFGLGKEGITMEAQALILLGHKITF